MTSPAPAARRKLADAAPALPFLPGAGVLAIWVALMPADGGYFARDWSPAGLAILALWAITLVTGGRVLPRSRAASAALVALAALGAFAFLSMTWAESPATAWSTANQFAVVVLSVWTLALLPWSAGSAQLFMGLFGVAATVVLAGSLLAAGAADDLAGYFVEDRWAAPLGYPNALANFGFFAALPLLAISAAPDRSPWLKGPALGAAVFLMGCGLLPQSRGSLLAMIVAVPVLIALSPRRWRTAARAAVAATALALASDPIFAVYDALLDERTFVSGPLEAAVRAILLAAVGATGAGLVLAFAESRAAGAERADRVARVSGYATVGLLALGLIGVAAVNADRIERVIAKQKTAWEKPRERYVDHRNKEGSRLLDPDPLQRYEYWHICLDALADNPLGGLGAGGFGPRYTVVRSFTKYAAYPHSLFMRAAGEAGIPGILGVLAFMAAMTAGLLAGWRRQGDGTRTVVAAAGAAATVFIVHAQFDWLEEFTSLAGAAVGFLLIATVVRRREAAPDPAPAPRRAWTAPAIAAPVALLLAVSVVLPYVALRYRERASAVWRTDVEQAYRDLDRAASLDPYSDVPKLSEGTIALQRRDYRRARAAFEAALEREEGWLAHFELALLDAVEGDERAAMRQLDVAERLNPQEAAIPAAREEIQAEEVVDPVRLNQRLFESPLFKPGRLT